MKQKKCQKKKYNWTIKFLNCNSNNLFRIKIKLTANNKIINLIKIKIIKTFLQIIHKNKYNNINNNSNNNLYKKCRYNKIFSKIIFNNNNNKFKKM